MGAGEYSDSTSSRGTGRNQHISDTFSAAVTAKSGRCLILEVDLDIGSDDLFSCRTSVTIGFCGRGVSYVKSFMKLLT